MRRLAAIRSDPHMRFWYLPVPKAASARLLEVGRRAAAEVGGAEADDADHMTLVYVPKAEAPLAPEEVEQVTGAIADALEGFSPFEVWTGGIAYFDTAERDGQPTTALVALIDGPGLSDLHEVVRGALNRLGWSWERNHTFTAHVTLAYLPQGARVVDLPTIDEAWTVDEVRFANDAVHRVPLRKQAAKDDFFANMQQKLEAERAIVEKIVAGGERPIVIPWQGGELFIHQDMHAGREGLWRITRLDGGEPVGHVNAESFADAVRNAKYYGARYADAMDARSGQKIARRRKRADLQGEQLFQFRTSPDTGNGPLYDYCNRCVHLARSSVSGVLGCAKGDDGHVRDYSERLDRGETSEEAEKCPGFLPNAGESDDDIVREAMLGIAGGTEAMLRVAVGEVPDEELDKGWNLDPFDDEDDEDEDGEDVEDVERALEGIDLFGDGFAPPPSAAPAPAPAPATSPTETVVHTDPTEPLLVIQPAVQRFVIWRTGYDACEKCAPYEGNVYDEDEIPPQGLPGRVHPGCECSFEPVGWLEASLIQSARQEAGMVKEVPSERPPERIPTLALDALDDALTEMWPGAIDTMKSTP